MVQNSSDIIAVHIIIKQPCSSENALLTMVVQYTNWIQSLSANGDWVW